MPDGLTSLCTTTCEISRERRWIVTVSVQSTSSAAASPARTSASPARAQGSPASAAGFGSSTDVSSRKSGRRGSSLKTSAPFALADWTRFSGNLLRSGTMRSGIVYPLPPLALLTAGTESGLWPTMRSGDGATSALRTRAQVMRSGGHKGRLEDFVAMWPTPSARDWKGAPASPGTLPSNSRPLNEAVRQRMWPTPHGFSQDGRSNGPSGNELGRAVNQSTPPEQAGGSLNPTWVEWLMGFPLGWTVLEPSATPSSRKSQN